MTDINNFHDIVGRMVDRAHERGDYPRQATQIEASRQMLEARLAADERRANMDVATLIEKYIKNKERGASLDEIDALVDYYFLIRDRAFIVPVARDKYTNVYFKIETGELVLLDKRTGAGTCRDLIQMDPVRIRREDFANASERTYKRILRFAAELEVDTVRWRRFLRGAAASRFGLTETIDNYVTMSKNAELAP